MQSAARVFFSAALFDKMSERCGHDIAVVAVVACSSERKWYVLSNTTLAFQICQRFFISGLDPTLRFRKGNAALAIVKQLSGWDEAVKLLQQANEDHAEYLVRATRLLRGVLHNPDTRETAVLPRVLVTLIAQYVSANYVDDTPTLKSVERSDVIEISGRETRASKKRRHEMMNDNKRVSDSGEKKQKN